MGRSALLPILVALLALLATALATPVPMYSNRFNYADVNQRQGDIEQAWDKGDGSSK